MKQPCLALLISLSLLAQRPDADAAKLRPAGVAESEITRRVDPLRNQGDPLEADRWNRFYGGGTQSKYHRAPNEFPAKVVTGLKPAVALDGAGGDGLRRPG